MRNALVAHRKLLRRKWVKPEVATPQPNAVRQRIDFLYRTPVAALAFSAVTNLKTA